MNKFNRDLLVLIKEEKNENLQHAVEQLHELLYVAERSEKMIQAHELININKRKIWSDAKHIKTVFLKKDLKPFVFLNNLN